MLKVSASCIVEQKSFIPKKNISWAVVNIKTKKLCLLTQFSGKVLHCTIYVPMNGGPITEAIPWKSIRSPKALVKLSSPSKSTKTTEVSPTYNEFITCFHESWIYETWIFFHEICLSLWSVLNGFSFKKN